MGLEDRIKEEMYVDAESLLEKEFERAQVLYEIYDDHTVALSERVRDGNLKPQILTHLIAQQYIAKAHEEQDSILSYDYFYERFDVDKSTIRHHFGDLVDDGLIQKGEKQGEYELVVERLADALDKIESETAVEDS